jgi:hypothetical protein
MEVVGGGLGVVRRLLHVEQVTVDVVLENEAGGVEPVTLG